MAVTWTDIITDAFVEIRVARAGDVIAPEMLDQGQRAANRILDLWNANRRAVFADTFTDFTLTPSLSPHTVGPSGTFVVAQRPVKIDAAVLNLGGTPNVFAPIDVHDELWYRALPVPAITSSVPTDLYYETAWPNGNLFFYPIPTTAYSVRLWMRVVLASITDVTATFSLPPGYQDALTMTLAERLASGNGQTASQDTRQAAKEAREIVFGNNDEIPDLNTLDGGMPGTGGGAYNYRTGSVG